MGTRPCSVAAPAAPSGAAPAFLVEAPFAPSDLPSPASAERWDWLQRLRGSQLALEPWLAAIEADQLVPDSDLLAVLAPGLDGEGVVRLLRWWRSQAFGAAAADSVDFSLPQRIGRLRDPAVAAELRLALSDCPDPAIRAVLLPLLGHQRCPDDFPLLRRDALRPAAAPVRRGALEGLCLGLSAWPLAELRTTLLQLATDLDVPIASTAVDALARLPHGRGPLLSLDPRRLDAGVAARLQRRLRRLPASPLLLLVHGRAQGSIPVELESLAAQLQQRRGAPVLLRALTDPQPADLPAFDRPLWLVPLLLLPGEHVRQDLPRLRRLLQPRAGLRALPFLGSWPCWQRALAAEAGCLARDPSLAADTPTLLLHHPVSSPLARRYLGHLSAITGATCQEAAYSPEVISESLQNHRGPVLPLALAANRLTEVLTPRYGAAAAPLLSRPGLQEVLFQRLEALP